MRTKSEVINFLESKVGTKVICPGRPDLNGQCVTLIKSLMEYLGVKDPYKARGHAKTAISAYLSEGIADKGTGFLSVFSNKNMGNGYGHIWCNAGDGAGTYYESNGAKPLIVTKGKTYPYDNVCNFDKYIKVETPPQQEEDMLLEYLGIENEEEAKAKLKEHLGELDGKCDWGNSDADRGGFLGSARRQNTELENEVLGLETTISQLKDDIRELNQQIEDHVCYSVPTEPEDIKWIANEKTETKMVGDTEVKINYYREE